MTDWQTIETAPKTDILLLWNGITLGTGYWLSFGRDEDGNAIGIDPEDQAECVDRWEWTGEGFPIEPEPTHWMPLPEPPESHPRDVEGDRIVRSGDITVPPAQPRLRGHVARVEPAKYAPPGCHCQEQCGAPVVMGRQQPCRDPEKAARFAQRRSERR